jgi:hypothetical protein
VNSAPHRGSRAASTKENGMKLYILISMMIFPGLAAAAGLESEGEAEQFLNAFTAQLLAEDFDEAFDSIRPHWPIPGEEIDGIVDTISRQWPAAKARFGDGVGIELVKKQSIGKSLLRYYYLHKFESHAIFWRIDLYKPTNEWKVNAVIFLDSLDALFD